MRPPAVTPHGGGKPMESELAPGAVNKAAAYENLIRRGCS